MLKEKLKDLVLGFIFGPCEQKKIEENTIVTCDGFRLLR